MFHNCFFHKLQAPRLEHVWNKVPELPELKSVGAFLKFGWVFKATFSPGRKTKDNNQSQFKSKNLKEQGTRALKLFHRTFLVDFFHHEGRKVACVDGLGETECYLDNTRGKQLLGWKLIIILPRNGALSP